MGPVIRGTVRRGSGCILSGEQLATLSFDLSLFFTRGLCQLSRKPSVDVPFRSAEEGCCVPWRRSRRTADLRIEVGDSSMQQGPMPIRGSRTSLEAWKQSLLPLGRRSTAASKVDGDDDEREGGPFLVCFSSPMGMWRT
jgi:hypothetical protein